MTGIPFGDNGFLLDLRDDDHCGPFWCPCRKPVRLGQRGCPLTGLPAADPWRPTAEPGSATTEETK